jgi:predicted adenine nucleotide alpha hydrolase (AANH) superfamily ATPase
MLREQGHAPTAYWFNPNIHPYTEYRARRDAVAAYMPTVNVPLVQAGGYDLRGFLQALPSYDDRCQTCYTLRLYSTAQYAAAQGFDSFTSTLLVSPYQNHAQLCAVAEKAAAKYGVPFLYCDFRERFREGQARARELGLYRQKYCGCMFSEEERYCNK